MSARINRYELTRILERPPFGEVGGGLQKPWKCHWPECKQSGMSTSRRKKYCDEHAKASKVKTTRAYFAKVAKAKKAAR